jgi:YjbE family integral membrane protein
MTPEDLLKVLQIILIDVVLSGDNAVVIAMAAHKLPEHQRKLAIWWGGGIAILMRILFTVLMALLLMLPGVRLIGGLILVWIACKLLLDEQSDEELELGGGKPKRSTWAAVRMIFVADFVMSLDNMLAVAGAAGERWWMVVMGLLVSIAIIMFCSSLIALLMNRYHWIVYLGAAILAFTAGEMIMGDRELAAYVTRNQHVSLNKRWEEDFMVTRGNVYGFQAAEPLPAELAGVVRYDAGRLEFIGQMDERQRDTLLELVSDEHDRHAISEMYETAQHREVPDWIPDGLKPQAQNWVQRRWPADVWQGIQGRQYHFVSKIVYALVVGFCLAVPAVMRKRKTASPPAEQTPGQST